MTHFGHKDGTCLLPPRTFLKFCTMKGAIRYIEIMLMAFSPKKILFGANGLFRTQMSSQLWIHCQDCFKILHNERGQERHGNFINGFSEKNLILGNFAVLAQKWYCSQFFFILHKNGAKRYMVVLLVVFLNKNHI